MTTNQALSTLRRTLYFTQRTISDYQALSNGGPARLGARLIRRPFRRALGRSLSRWGL